MKSRHFITLALSGLLLTSQPLLAGDKIELDYHYTDDTGVSLSSMMGGPLSISSFTDQRAIGNKHDINRAEQDAVTLSQPPAAIIQQAFHEAFVSADAQLGEAETPLTLSGKLLEMEIVESDSGTEVLIRCELTLNNQGRNAWQSVVFSRVNADNQALSATIAQGLDRLVNELFLDDYFLMELGIF
ncbi:hypothetical protein [Pseudohongiella sp.]|uniref:Uncharacterized protein n=1 Tax=marine sediment metagenome TaxID=412755 RepID=A0A0F9U5C3_9ZZZZ|nr:hypothetical protein [Pseudohongiella sp.]HDZ08247.1 hypothetical protein [Pseudohongiella sp.]HEA63687.1 hypothetical protein [Pseudohongiella sp.]